MTRDEATQELAKWTKQMKDHGVPNYSARYTALDMAIEALQAEPVKHGEWINKDTIHDEKAKVITEWQEAQCSACGKWHTTPYMYYFDYFNYCPNCGAKMDKE